MEKRTHAKHIILILLGSLILSFGIYNLNYQNNITEGGVLGLLLLLKNLFNIEPSVAQSNNRHSIIYNSIQISLENNS